MRVLKNLVITLTIVGTAAGCSINGGKFDELAPNDQASFHGTQTGYNRLSDHFVASVNGGRWDTRLMQFYYYPYGNGPKELIGITSATLFDDADFGPQNEHFAVSADGQSLLYFHEAEFGYGKTTDRPDGLYLFTHGEGYQWLRPIGERVIDPTEIDRYLAR